MGEERRAGRSGAEQGGASGGLVRIEGEGQEQEEDEEGVPRQGVAGERLTENGVIPKQKLIKF